MGNILSQTLLDNVLRPTNLIILAVTLYGIILARHLVSLRTALAGIGNLPGPRNLYGPYSLLGRILPPIPYVVRKLGWQFKWKYGLHQYYGSDIVSSVVLFNNAPVSLCLADAAVVKQVTTNRSEFPKPLQLYKFFSMFGDNIIATEADEWKRHRRVVAPSFSEKNNRFVYEETTRIVTELFQLWATDGDAEMVKVDDAVTVTSRLALMVIAAAGFGSRFGWDEMDQPPAGHTITFQKALTVVLSNIVLRLFLSDGILRLWKGGRDIIVAFKELRVYMGEMIKERRLGTTEGSSVQADLFTNLINGTSANPDEEAEDQLLDDELMGNVFIFLFAGHETTAHSLAFTLALLAVYQDIQEKAFNGLRAIVPEGETPTYAHIMKWSYGLAITYESLRIFPPVTSIPKYAAHDTIFTTTSADGKNTPITIPVPKGTDLMINIAALHYSPKYWDEPEVFRPERFLGDYNRDAFIPFAAGPRACIGRRFSEIESVTFLAHLILKYRFEATPVDYSETMAEKKERLLRWKQKETTLSPEKVPLTFILRHKQ